MTNLEGTKNMNAEEKSPCPCNSCGLNDEEWYCQLQCGVYQRWLESEVTNELYIF